MTALLGAVVTMGVFGAGTAHAALDPCASTITSGPDIGPDGKPVLHLTSYVACLNAAKSDTAKPGPDCPTADLLLLATTNPDTVSPGDTTDFSAVGFAPGSDVNIVLCSTPVSLGTFQADADGNVNETLTVPSGTTLGSHTIAAVGGRVSGVQQVAYAGLEVVSPSVTTTSGALPTTGSDNGHLIAIGAALVVLGLAAVFGSMRAGRPATVETD